MKFILNKKINAGALQYTLFVAVLIVLLISTFLTLTYLQNQFKAKSNFQIQSIQNSDLAFQYISENELPYNEEITIQFPASFENEINFFKTPWGVFDVVSVISKVKNETFQKIGLVGGFQKKRPALYLKENYNALVLVGNTKIQGDVYVSEQGVKRGNIAGHSYYGGELIYGGVNRSLEKLPIIKNRNTIEELISGRLNEEGIEFIELYEGLKKINSFHQPTLKYKQTGVIYLYNIELTGNIIIQSDTLIKVDKSAYLSDILLIAPTIEIKDQVIGNFQAFASEKITIGTNCKLTYPTALILDEKIITNQNEKFSQLIINSNSLIKGIVAFLTEDDKANYKRQIILDENSKIVGEVYCDKNIELKGEVLGSVYTSGFITNQFGSVYQNHIYNGRIIEPELPEQYVGLTFNNSKVKVSKWLY